MKKLVFLIFTVLAGIALTGCINDNDPVTLVSIAVTSQPINKTYFVNEPFNTAGMVVTATYNDGSTEPVTITDAMLTYDFSTAGADKTVIIIYEDKSATITDIIVNPIIFEFDVMVTGVYIYTGKPIEPSGTNVTVKIDNVTLTEGDDYTLSYSDNTDIGTATVTVVGTGNYAGSNGMASFIIFPPFTGIGTSTEPYEIGTSAQLAKLAELVNAVNFEFNNKYYKLTADIDLSDYGEGWNNGKGWIPIGRGFHGYFDGNNHKVIGLYINDDSLDFAGLFGAVFYGTVQNLSVDGNVTGRNFVGGLTGQVAYNGKIINCCVSGIVCGNEIVGGIAGRISSGSSVYYCYATSAVSCNGNYIGGIAGYVEDDYGLVGVKSCLALNPNVTLTSGSAIGRVTAKGALASNVAWDGMLVNGSNITSKDGSSIHGIDIDKVNTKIQLAYTDYRQFGLDWQFGDEDYKPWKMGVGNYPLPVFWWQTKEPTADITHLE